MRESRGGMGAFLFAALLLFAPGCGRPANSADALPQAAQVIPSMGGRGLTVGVSPDAGDEAVAWVKRSASLLRFTPVIQKDGWVVLDWEAALLDRRLEAAWVRVAEVGVPREGLELGELVRLPSGESVVPVMRAGSKWRGALNAAAKISKEEQR